jgi:hypothetical protein
VTQTHSDPSRCTVRSSDVLPLGHIIPISGGCSYPFVDSVHPILLGWGILIERHQIVECIKLELLFLDRPPQVGKDRIDVICGLPDASFQLPSAYSG